MKKFLLLIFVLPLAIVANGQAWNYQWAHGFGSPGDEDDQVLVATDSEDNVYVALEYLGEITVSGVTYPAPADEGRDVLIVKMSAAGEILWSGSISGDGQANVPYNGDLVEAIHVDDDDNLLAIGNLGTFGTVFGNPTGIDENIHGTVESRNYIIKISPEGDILWHVFADADYLNDQLTALTTNAAGDIFVTGRTESAGGGQYGIGGTLLGDWGEGAVKYTLTKITAEGSVEYITGLPTGVPTGIQLTSTGDFIISSMWDPSPGSSLHKISADDFSTIWSRELPNSSGNTPQSGNLGFHIKADDSIVQFLKINTQMVFSDATADCNMYCTMGALINIDPSGNTVSVHTMESLIENPVQLGIVNYNFNSKAFTAIDDDTYYLAGSLEGDVLFDNGFNFEPSESFTPGVGNPKDAFVIKVDGDLNVLEYATQTGTAAQTSSDIAVFSNGDVAMGGVHKIETFGGFTGTTVFGDVELTGYGDDDYFVTRLTTGPEAPLGMDDKNAASASFVQYPVPAGDVLNIHLSTSTAHPAVIQIRDMSGRLLISEQQSFANEQATIDVSDLQNGCYITSIHSESGETLSRPFTILR